MAPIYMRQGILHRNSRPIRIPICPGSLCLSIIHYDLTHSSSGFSPSSQIFTLSAYSLMLLTTFS